MSKDVQERDETFEKLLEHLRSTRGFDFSGYKRTSLMRRVRKRMAEVHIESYGDYLDYLEVHPDEFVPLFNTILINVTSFFRDPGSWDYIRDHVVPAIVESKEPGESIRIWSAGSASGQEAYTLAIVFCEVLGDLEFRRRVKIYATDVDDDALAQGRAANYTPKEVSSLPDGMLDKYFEKNGSTTYSFRSDLRRSIIFGRHDLVQHAPISRVDLILCRNTLMYFNAETQGRILARLHFALNQKGFLFLGKAELLLTHTDLFAASEMKHRVFSKVARPVSVRDHLAALGEGRPFDIPSLQPRSGQLRDIAFERSSVSQIVVNSAGNMIMATSQARLTFGLTSRDIGRPLQDLELSYRPVELRSRIDQAYEERRTIHLRNVERVFRQGEVQYLDVEVVPLFAEDGGRLGVLVSFSDVTRYNTLQSELRRSTQELESAYEELQSTNEELETTNEELQATVEELETTNEELHASNEELETMNEELQSTNDELRAVNDDLRKRSGELDRVNAFMAAVVGSMKIGVAAIGPDHKIQTWNDGAFELWGLREQEVRGQDFFSLDIGIDVTALRKAVDAGLASGETDGTVTLSAVNRRGKKFDCAVTVSPLHGEKGDDTPGVVLLMQNVSS